MSTIAALSFLLAACAEDEGAGDVIESEVEERADQLGARSAAESVRADLLARDLTNEEGEDENLRGIGVLEEATDNIPGEPEVVGLEDTSGDGLDDDGLVEIWVGDEAACLAVGEDSETVDVSGSTCD